MPITFWKYILQHLGFHSKILETSGHYSLYYSLKVDTPVPLVNRIRYWKIRRNKRNPE